MLFVFGHFCLSIHSLGSDPIYTLLATLIRRWRAHLTRLLPITYQIYPLPAAHPIPSSPILHHLYHSLYLRSHNPHNSEMLGLAVTLLVAASSAKIASAQYSATYEINNLPNNSEQGQSGTNECTTTNSDGSTCQTLVVNSIEDFCLWAPPEPNSAIGDTEQIEGVCYASPVLNLSSSAERHECSGMVYQEWPRDEDNTPRSSYRWAYLPYGYSKSVLTALLS